MLAYPEVQDRAHAELDEVSPLSPLHPRDSQRDAALVAHGPVRCSARLECRRLVRGCVNTKGTICLLNMRMTNSEMDVFVIGAAQFNPARYLDESC